MRNAILMLLFAGVAFGSSAAGSWYLQSKIKPKSDEESSAESEMSASSMEGGTESDSESMGEKSSGDLPVAVRPRPMSVEEVLRFGMGLRKREEQLNARDQSLDQEKARLELAMADIRGEQQQIEGLQTKLEGQGESCRALLSEIQQARQQFAKERENAQEEIDEFKEVRTESNAEETQNIKQMSEWMQNMEPEKAAGALQKFVDEGKMDLAIRLLSNFEEREAAKILSALDDYGLMVELAERFKNYKRPAKPEKRR